MRIFLHLVTFFSCSLVLAANPFVGKWKTIDDDTNKPKSIVEIYEENNQLSAKVESLFPDPTKEPNPKCDKCVGEKKDKPVIGMQIMWGLNKDSETKYSGGDIMDPNNGKTYSCKLELIENGAKLKVRGFIGFSLLGRTQIWERKP